MSCGQTLDSPAAQFAAIGKPQRPNTMLLPPSGRRRGTGDYAAIQLAIKVLERREAERACCIFLALFESHPPYTICADFYDLYRADEIPPLAPPGLPKRPRFHAALREFAGLGAVTSAEFRRLRAVYYGQVTYVDWLLGELTEALERTGHARDTALFVGSDHGDYAGDYGCRRTICSMIAPCRLCRKNCRRGSCNWYIDTTGVPPPERDPSGAPVLDRLPELQHAPPSSDLLDH